jgi:chaperonin GroEL
MDKELYFDCEEGMLKGFYTVADAAIGTLGAKGRNVYIGGNIPKITNDGANITASITLPDKLEEAGGYVIKNACAQTADDAGDATTTTASLAKAIMQECVKRPESVMEVEKSLKQAGEKVLKTLAKKATKIDKKDIYKVALTTAENEDLATKITEIFAKLGDKAEINVEDSKTFSTEYEITDGYTAHVGFMSSDFITETKTSQAIYEDIPVLCCEKKINSIGDISPIFNMFAFETNKEGKILIDGKGEPVPSKNPISKCVIVCDDIDDSMLGMFVANKKGVVSPQGQLSQFHSVVIRATSLLLEDIAGYTGAKIISNATGVNFQNFRREHLGFCKKVICGAKKTQFIGDGNSHKQYVKELRAAAEAEPNMYIQKNMNKRVSTLSGGIATLRIGAPTDLDREYLKDKADDTKRAVQGALEEGTQEGGGMTLWRIAQDMKPKTIGEEILKKALTAPLRDILRNAGKDYTEIVLNMPKGMGYDVLNERYADMIKVGIMDTQKSIRCALENAVSAVSKLRTVFLVITEKVKDND